MVAAAIFYNLQFSQIHFYGKISLFLFSFFVLSSTRRSAFRFRAQHSCDSYVLDVNEVILLYLFQPALVPVKGYQTFSNVYVCVRACAGVCVCCVVVVVIFT